MEESADNTAKQLERVSAELTDCQENFENLATRLDEAESILRYYANVTNYKVPKISALVVDVYQHCLNQDCEKVAKNTFVAGKRARDYLKRFNEDLRDS